MPWRVHLSPPARRQRAGLGDADRAAVHAALERLAATPAGVDFKKLPGVPGWRLRVGLWDAILSLDARTGVMLVQRVVNRRDAYR